MCLHSPRRRRSQPLHFACMLHGWSSQRSQMKVHLVLCMSFGLPSCVVSCPRLHASQRHGHRRRARSLFLPVIAAHFATQHPLSGCFASRVPSPHHRNKLPPRRELGTHSRVEQRGRKVFMVHGFCLPFFRPTLTAHCSADACSCSK